MNHSHRPSLIRSQSANLYLLFADSSSFLIHFLHSNEAINGIWFYFMYFFFCVESWSVYWMVYWNVRIPHHNCVKIIAFAVYLNLFIRVQDASLPKKIYTFVFSMFCLMHQNINKVSLNFLKWQKKIPFWCKDTCFGFWLYRDPIMNIYV